VVDILNVRDAAVLKKGDRLSSAARGRQPMKVRMRMDMIWSASTGAVVLDVDCFKSSFSVFDHMSRSSWKDGCRSAFPDWDSWEYLIMDPYIDRFRAYISDAGKRRKAHKRQNDRPHVQPTLIVVSLASATFCMHSQEWTVFLLLPQQTAYHNISLAHAMTTMLGVGFASPAARRDLRPKHHQRVGKRAWKR